jgi:membrane-associated protein
MVTNYGPWSYGILFLIIFLETGFVFTPFLPGDSLIFAAGTLAAQGSLNIFMLFLLLAAAAVLGDTVNYWVGNYIGRKILNNKNINKIYIVKTRHFFEKYGNKTIILARFFPIIRTFAPFLAGVGKMSYWKFLVYNIIGGILWVSIFVFGGYFFGNIPFVKNNFTLVLIIIILVSIVPALVEVVRHYRNKKKSRQSNKITIKKKNNNGD